MLVACRRSGDARADGLQAQMIRSGLSCELAALVRVTIDGEEVTLANGYRAEPRALDLAVEELFARVQVSTAYRPLSEALPLDFVHRAAEAKRVTCLKFHAEKKALAHLLLHAAPELTMRVNIRVCADCHSFLAHAASMLGRVIRVLEPSRQHVFNETTAGCSCQGLSNPPALVDANDASGAAVAAVAASSTAAAAAVVATAATAVVATLAAAAKQPSTASIRHGLPCEAPRGCRSYAAVAAANATVLQHSPTVQSHSATAPVLSASAATASAASSGAPAAAAASTTAVLAAALTAIAIVPAAITAAPAALTIAIVPVIAATAVVAPVAIVAAPVAPVALAAAAVAPAALVSAAIAAAAVAPVVATLDPATTTAAASAAAAALIAASVGAGLLHAPLEEITESDDEIDSHERATSSIDLRLDAARLARLTKGARKNARRRSRAAAQAAHVRERDRAHPFASAPPNDANRASARALVAALAVAVGLAVAAAAAVRMRRGASALSAWFATATAASFLRPMRAPASLLTRDAPKVATRMLIGHRFQEL